MSPMLSDALQPEKPNLEQQPTPDISSVEADKIELEKYSKTLKVPVDQVIPTLTASELGVPLPTEKQVIQLKKDKTQLEIESILEKDMLDIYNTLPPDAKPMFKKQGEKTALDIAAMIKSGKFNAEQVFEDIDMWLKIIPGTNRHFLEQEAKLRTDQIAAYVEDLKPKT